MRLRFRASQLDVRLFHRKVRPGLAMSVEPADVFVDIVLDKPTQADIADVKEVAQNDFGLVFVAEDPAEKDPPLGLRSPDGSQFLISVDDSGRLSTRKVT